MNKTGLKLKGMFLLFLIAFMSVFLTGCMKTETNLKLNRNGSLDVDHKILLSKELESFSEDFLYKIKNDAINNNYEVLELNELGMPGLKLMRSYKDAQQAKCSEIHKMMKCKNDQLFEITKGLFATNYKLNALIDFTPTYNHIENKYIKNSTNNINFVFSMEIPAKSFIDNADFKLKQGKLLKWETNFSEFRHYKAEIHVLNLFNIAVFSFTLFVLLIMLILYKKNIFDFQTIKNHKIKSIFIITLIIALNIVALARIDLFSKNKVPEYEIVATYNFLGGKHDEPIKDSKNFIVLIKPININNDSFKKNIMEIVSDIYKFYPDNDHKPISQITIYDDPDSLSLDYSSMNIDITPDKKYLNMMKNNREKWANLQFNRYSYQKNKIAVFHREGFSFFDKNELIFLEGVENYIQHDEKYKFKKDEEFTKLLNYKEAVEYNPLTGEIGQRLNSKEVEKYQEEYSKRLWEAYYNKK